jgi:hypothetical protein
VLRTLLCCIALAALAVPVRAEQTLTSTEMLIRLTVRPKAAPKPALRYLLLPELREMHPGNPIPNYLRCLMDQDFSANRETLGPAALREADRAARLDKPDWQILPKLKTDGIGLLIPDVQKLRTLAAGLKERFHEEVVQGHIDDAIRTAKTMFAMSRHMSEHPTLIGELVGIAIAFVAIEPLEEMLEQPGCPNFYWALTNLPNPLVTLDKGMDGERVLIGGEFRDLSDSAPMNAEQLKKMIGFIDTLRELAGLSKVERTRAWLDKRIKDKELVQAARRRLIEVGLAEEALARFSAEQVLLLDQKREFEVQRDEVMKLMNLPAWQCEELADQIKPAKEKSLFYGLVPALRKVRRAQARLEQRMALLRHVEALRLYAAEHDGKLPQKLSDIAVPLPDDPFTGKPFRYEVKGTTAHLRGSPPRSEEKVPGYNVHYEITIQKP